MSPLILSLEERERHLKETPQDGTVKTAEEEELAAALCCRVGLDQSQLNYPG